MAAEAGAGGATLLGRRSECEALDRLLTDVVSGTSRVMVLRGDAGVGKSELLGYLSKKVAGWRVATAVGVESEMELAYSGLHQLCGPLLDHLDRLPVPQREALATVFGLGVGPPPDRFLVGLATAQPLGRRRRATASGLHRGRRPVARPGLRTNPCFCRPSSACRAGRPGLFSAYGQRRRGPRRAA